MGWCPRTRWTGALSFVVLCVDRTPSELFCTRVGFFSRDAATVAAGDVCALVEADRALAGADLPDADLPSADLAGADLAGADLTADDLALDTPADLVEAALLRDAGAALVFLFTVTDLLPARLAAGLRPTVLEAAGALLVAFAPLDAFDGWALLVRLGDVDFRGFAFFADFATVNRFPFRATI